MALRRFGLAPDEEARIVAEAAAMLRVPEIRAIFSKERYRGWGELELWREHPFAVRLDSCIMTGTFDRLVVGLSGGRAAQVEAAARCISRRRCAASFHSRGEREERRGLPFGGGGARLGVRRFRAATEALLGFQHEQ
jgi:hypothetical protein